MKKKDELQNRKIADFSLRKNFEDIGKENTEILKRHLLDSLGSLFHATTKPAVHKLKKQILTLSDGGRCTAPGIKHLAVDRAAQYYTALIRYPDFMDNYMGKEATCHPSDNIGVLLAVSQLRRFSGRDFLTAMAIAYQIECRLVEEIPVMIEGVDHTLFLAYSLVASAGRLLGLSREQIAHALGIAGCSISPMVTSRASYTYEWKGFASSLEALVAVNCTLLAKEGMTGPIALFEGPKGFKEIFGMDLKYDWEHEDFSLLKKCTLKSYNGEVHTQPAIEAAIELRSKHNFRIEDIKAINVTVFLTAYHITGSGAYGDRTEVETKEQADHSLFYLVAVALLDDEVYPAQFETERIQREDVQGLLQKVSVKTKFPLHKPIKVAGALDPNTRAYPDKMLTTVDIELNDGRTLSCEKEDYIGFFTKPFTWERTIGKFKRLCADVIDEDHQNRLIATIMNLENEDMNTLLTLINTVPVSVNRKLSQASV